MGFFSLGSMSSWVISVLVVLLLLLWLARIVEWIWWRPKKLERLLKEQGIRGNPYRLLFGDVRDSTRMLTEAQSKPLPLFSHDIASRVVPILVQIMKDHGKTSLTWVGTRPRVIITDPVLIREILSKVNDFKKPEKNSFTRFIRTGLVDYEGEKWVKHRRIINPTFHLEKLKHMLPAFSTCCSKMIDRWEKLVSSEGSSELDVWPELQSFTRDAISQTAFGSSYEEGKHIFQLQTEQAEILIRSIRNIYIPGYRFFPTRDNRRCKEIEREIRALLWALIVKREKAMKAGVKSDDLLGYLMDSNSEYSQENGKSQNGMTIEEVIDECKLFYLAGQETTSVLLTWTMILLCIYPSWQNRAREEVLRIFGKNKPNFDALNHLKIVTMILYEVLRLYPPLVSLLRNVHKEIELGELTLPAGVDLILPAVFVHHDLEYWGKDAHYFNPERFAEGISKASKSQMAFFPFSGGPRVCIGQGFAMIEAKLAMCMILQHFSFELSPSYIHAPRSVITLQPQHGARLMLQNL